MIDKKYHLKFLGLFKEDLYEIVDYIVDELNKTKQKLQMHLLMK